MDTRVHSITVQVPLDDDDEDDGIHMEVDTETDPTETDPTVTDAASLWSSAPSHRTLSGPLPDSPYRHAWLWVRGWRARLTAGGDVVERERWRWRVEDQLRLGRGRVVKGGTWSLVDGIVSGFEAEGRAEGKGAGEGRVGVRAGWSIGVRARIERSRFK